MKTYLADYCYVSIQLLYRYVPIDIDNSTSQERGYVVDLIIEFVCVVSKDHMHMKTVSFYES